jgi:hypothetical protein
MTSDTKIQTYDPSADRLGRQISGSGSAVAATQAEAVATLKSAVREQANQIAAFIIRKSAPSAESSKP